MKKLLEFVGSLAFAGALISLMYAFDEVIREFLLSPVNGVIVLGLFSALLLGLFGYIALKEYKDDPASLMFLAIIAAGANATIWGFVYAPAYQDTTMLLPANIVNGLILGGAWLRGRVVSKRVSA